MTKYSFCISLLVLFITIISCSLLIPSVSEHSRKSTWYKIDFSDPDWEKISPDKSDMAFLNKETGSILILNSLCKKYEQTSLGQLSSKILSGLSNLEIEESREFIFSGREAISVNASGTLDGVKVKLKIMTFKKDRCTYDIAIINSKGRIPSGDEEDFNRFINSMRFEKR